ncbi:MAG: dihydrolipoyl dehydrogenase [Leptospirales bacterium]|nr:dihydrolipoyl dehydrogenase [Leptospirales bacterium]
MSETNEVFDVAIIGGGPGGYVCAIRCAQLGLKTALIEKRPTLGGTCVNVGCIPSKALLDTSHKYAEAQHGLDAHGISVKDVRIDISKMMARKTQVVKELTDGLNFLMKKNKITVFQGAGSFQSHSAEGSVIQVDGAQKATVRARRSVIATGSDTIQIPGVPIDGEVIVTSDQAISFERVPERLTIIGAGVIGLELGSVWSRLGSKVQIVEMLPSLLGPMDRQFRELAQRSYEKQGLSFLLEHKVEGAERKGSRAIVRVADKDGKKKELEADRVLVAVGRRPYVEGLNLEAVGVKLTKRGRIEADPHTLQCSTPGIYAIGDVIEGGMLAHRAEEEGVMVAEILAGKPGHVNYDALPYIVYTWPEVAWVGKSEEALQAEGKKVRSGKFFFKPNGRAKAMNESEGLIKFIADERTDKLLGVFILGPNASELIAEAAVAMEFGAGAEDIGRSFHAHPTLSEAMKEAALDVGKSSIHQ